MSLYDFNAPRLYIDNPLREGEELSLDRAQANYLINVLRLRNGDAVLVFNGRDGEWRAGIAQEGRKSASLHLVEKVREQTEGTDILYLFAPIKHARLDYMVQKSVEMGVGSMRPVFTARTQSGRVNLDRMKANAIEAAEQCGILNLPEILPEMKLPAALDALEPDRLLVFCDEDTPPGGSVEALKTLGKQENGIAVIVGPEGGFTEQERALIMERKPHLRLSLGPRILRADTAAVAVLALVQAVIGDWN